MAMMPLRVVRLCPENTLVHILMTQGEGLPDEMFKGQCGALETEMDVMVGLFAGATA